MKKLIQFKLKFLAKRILKKYKPKVVGVTGSVGKTSTKEAISTVLAARYATRGSVKNYNNELGVPLSIIGCESPGRSLWGWIKVFFFALKLVVFKDQEYPEILVLEMGIDRPGDMHYLTKVVKPDVGVVTLIGPSHLEYFKTIRGVQKEKGVLIQQLKKGGWAILNHDNKETLDLRQNSKQKVLTFGFEEGADVRAQNLIFNFEENKDINNLLGIGFKLNYKGSTIPVRLPKVIGYPIIYSALAAASVGASFGMNLVEISKALEKLDSPKGRMKLIKGIKETMIIDDTYNSSPQSCISALDVISKVDLSDQARKWVVLGDMLELGSYTEEGHREVGRYLVKAGFDNLITVGERAGDIARGAQEAGMNEDYIFKFKDSESSKKFVQDRIKKGDIILVKGSQGVRMEKIVKEIMASPMQAKELLVRQDGQWENR